MRVLDHGEVELIAWMPQRDLDAAITKAARVSYGDGTRTVSDDRTLIRYLLRHGHTSPFEMVEFQWRIKCPLFVARQWLRHRTASVNEVSARYSDMSDVEFHLPEWLRGQSSANKQGSEGTVDDSTHLCRAIRTSQNDARFLYQHLLGRGVAREQARVVLPTSMYTEFVWKCDLHNTLRFLRLRTSLHAQPEIRVYAESMLGILRELVPVTIEAWEDFEKNAMTLTALDIEALRTGRMSDRATPREIREFEEKRKVLYGTHQPGVCGGAEDQAPSTQ